MKFIKKENVNLNKETDVTKLKNNTNKGETRWLIYNSITLKEHRNF